MTTRLRLPFMLLAVVCLGLSAFAKESGRSAELSRLQESATVLSEIMAAPDKGVPQDVISSAKCVAVVPSLLKGGFILGGAYGKGVVSCRTQSGWSAPAFFRIEGGSVGLQAGGEAVDLVMLIMNDRGKTALMTSKFKIGADASAAAGPVGRQAEGSTDWKMRAEILTYSRARGIFAGISLKGDAILRDEDSTREFYGRRVPFRTILLGNIATPEDGKSFSEAIAKYAGK